MRYPKAEMTFAAKRIDEPSTSSEMKRALECLDASSSVVKAGCWPAASCRGRRHCNSARSRRLRKRESRRPHDGDGQKALPLNRATPPSSVTREACHEPD